MCSISHPVSTCLQPGIDPIRGCALASVSAIRSVANAIKQKILKHTVPLLLLLLLSCSQLIARSSRAAKGGSGRVPVKLAGQNGANGHDRMEKANRQPTTSSLVAH